jgi:hypothetical protein
MGSKRGHWKRVKYVVSSSEGELVELGKFEMRPSQDCDRGVTD